MEESGGAQVGPFTPWNERGDTIHRDKDTCALALALFCLAARLRNEGSTLLEFYLEMAGRFGSLAYFERLDAYVPDQATAEDPQRQAEAEATKQGVLDRLLALQQKESRDQLLGLFGLQAAGIGAEFRPQEEITLLEKVGETWQSVHPSAVVHRLVDGGALEWFRGGTFDHDGMKITCRSAAGEVRFWCLVRASGTEAILRVYMEIVEPLDAPNPQPLADLFRPFLTYLGLDQYRLKASQPSYVEAFEAELRKKYPTQ
jgi:phosphomannomutase